jgi:hypothetical protein
LEPVNRRTLFEAPELGGDLGRTQYAVLENGQSFLFNARYDKAEPRSITVVFNWPRAAAR